MAKKLNNICPYTNIYVIRVTAYLRNDLVFVIFPIKFLFAI